MRKKQLLSVLAVVFCGLLISQASFAGTAESAKVNDDVYMKERAIAISHYLEEKYASGSLLIDDTDFFAENPQYRIDSKEAGKKESEKIETINLDIRASTRVMNFENDNRLIEVDFYSDGTYIVSELEKEVLPPDNQSVSRAGDGITPRTSIIGKNTHNIKNGLGQNIGRSYVEVNFSYNGKKVTYGNRGANARCLLHPYRVQKVGNEPVMSYPAELDANSCRAEYQSFWYKPYGAGETLALLDINRVTCTPQGKIFRSTPKVAL